MIEDRLGQIENDIRDELEENEILDKCETEHPYDEKTLEVIKSLLDRLSVTAQNVELIGNATIKQVMKNVENSSKIKRDFDSFHDELNKIRSETEELNKNLPIVQK